MKHPYRSFAAVLLVVAGALSSQAAFSQQRSVSSGVIRFQGAIVVATQPAADISLSQLSATNLRSGKQTLNPPGRTITVQRMADLSASERSNPVIDFHLRGLAEQHLDPKNALYLVVNYQ